MVRPARQAPALQKGSDRNMESAQQGALVSRRDGGGGGGGGKGWAPQLLYNLNKKQIKIPPDAPPTHTHAGPPCTPHCLLFDILSQGLNSQAASKPLCLMSPTGFDGGAGRLGGGLEVFRANCSPPAETPRGGGGASNTTPRSLCVSVV